ncbi:MULTISPECIES: DUF4403 family protein [Hydrocarboniphaga]|uniref:DUF4403 family protein n=1 Tax=Hydrocarboniphaga effusa AP103 TaxID=1172194 RepID=I8TER8_9GAMM|nr:MULTISPECIES: DUF4403 family protein [Hydrocarboniphaga]EIT72218.1 hypothetical protein WQQ_23550 [Hydrocarboniphaga effusa AP103]MDZ4079648.1 DUF4403 family protein [Hydrocarboniphaga sp.]
MVRSRSYAWLQPLLICTLASACTQRIESGETLPAAASEPPQLQRLSRIELRASLPLAQIQAALDEALPRQQDIDERIRIRVPLIDDPRIPFHGSVTRTPLQLRPASPAIAFSSVLDGHGSAPTRWTVRGRVDGRIQPMIDGAYRVRSRLESSVDIDEARLKLDHLPDISLRKLLTERYRDAQRDWAAKLDRKLDERLALRDKASRLWRSAYGAVPLRSRSVADYELTLLHQPMRLLLANPVATASGDVVFGLGLEGQLSLAVGGTPRAPAARALPAPRFVDTLGNRFDLELPIAVDLGKLAQALEQQLHEGKLRFERRNVKVEGVGAGSDGKELVLKLRIEAGTWFRRTKADVFMHAVPFLDEATHELALRELRYTLQSEDLLLRAASWLTSPKLLAELQGKARLPLAPLEAQARDAAAKLAADVSKRSDGLAQIDVQRVSVDALSLHPGYLLVLVSAGGEVHADLAALLR